MDAINRPADRTVELMGQSTEQTLQSIKAMVKSPGLKTATNAALNVLGLPFSPITSVVDAFAGDPASQLAQSLGASPKTDPYIRAAVQTILPIAATKSALLKAALGAEGAFLTGGLSPGTPPLKPGQAAETIAQKLIKHDQQSIAQDVKLKRSYEEFIASNPDYVKHDEELYHAGEDPKVPLSPRAAYLKKTYIDPVSRRNELYLNELKQLGVKTGDTVDPKTYMHRQAIEQTDKKGFWGTLGDVVDPTGALSNTAPTKGFSTKPEALHTPNAGTVRSSLTGEEGGYVIHPETGQVDIYKNGKVIDKGTEQNGKVLTKNGGVWDMARGTTKEVEQHTPVRYQKSALASVLETQRQLRDAVANARFMQGLKTSPEFLQLARPPGAPTPKGWEQVSIPGYHGLDGWKTEPRLKEVLDDYTGVQIPANVLLQGANRLMQGSIFINPMGHILNVQTHAAVEAGLFGGMVRTIEGGVRAITPGEKTLTRRAVEAVITKNSDYIRYVRESAGLKGANNYIRDFGNTVLKEMGKNPQQLAPVAQAMGYANPMQWLRAAYGASNKTLWGVGDIILMKSFLARELERGVGQEAEIAAHVTEHIPDYVIPSRAGSDTLAGRGLAQILKSPYALAFSRYEYNRLASYGNLMKGLVQGDAMGRVEAADQIAALVFHTAVTYPMIDYAIQKATGNKNAKLRGFGPFIFTENMKDYEAGKKGIAQATVQTVGRPSAVVELGMEGYQNRDWRGKPIYGHGGQFGAYLASKTYPTQALYRIVNPPKGVSKQGAVRQFILEQVGIKDPTPEQEAVAEKYARIELKKRQTNKP